MYVSAPHRDSNGLTLVPVYFNAKSVSAGGGNYQTIGEAEAHRFNFTASILAAYGFTTKGFMQSGIIGYRQYTVTPYSAGYCNRRVFGYASNISTPHGGGGYFVETRPVGFYSGLLDSGVNQGSPLDAIAPQGGGFDAVSIYNRAVVASAKNRCLAEAKNKLSEQKMDLSESLVDIPSTVKMVAEKSMQILYAWRSIRNGNYALAARHLGISRRNLNFDSAAKAWLELQYGWKPLANDVFAGIAQVNQALKEPGSTVQAVRRVSDTLWILPPPKPSAWGEFRYTGSARCSVEVKFKARISDANLAYLSGLQALNPLYTAWVATPFSFVVDWFLPVGDWLSSITATLGLTFVSGYRTTRIWGEEGIVASKHSLEQPLVYKLERQIGEASYSAQQAYIDRERFDTWPISQLYFRFPFSSSERIASAIALTKTTSKLR